MSGISIRLSRRVPWSQDGSRKTLPVLFVGHGSNMGMETRGREWLLVGWQAGLALFRPDLLKMGQNQTFIRTDLTSEGEEGNRWWTSPGANGACLAARQELFDHLDHKAASAEMGKERGASCGERHQKNLSIGLTTRGRRRWVETH